MLIAHYIGWIGTILGLISTAGIFPTLIERGHIDWFVARPLSRWKLFFGKFVGSLFFMTVQATFFVLLTFLIVGFRWHVQQAAARAGVCGYVRNLPDGDVEVAAEGLPGSVEAVVEAVRRGPRSSRVERLDRRDLDEPRRFDGFEVRF